VVTSNPKDDVLDLFGFIAEQTGNALEVIGKFGSVDCTGREQRCGQSRR